MYVIVSGAGSLGSALAASLVAAGHEVFVIDPDAALLARAQEGDTCFGLRGEDDGEEDGELSSFSQPADGSKDGLSTESRLRTS